MNSCNSARWVKLWLVMFTLFGLGGLGGCTKRGTNSVDQELRALETLKGRSWYDADKMAYRPPQPSSDFDSPVRINGWEAPPPPPPPPPKPATTGWNWGWSSGFFEDWFVMIVWLILGLVLVGLVVWLAGSSMQYWGVSKKLSKQAKAIAIDPARVVDLPFEAQVEMQDPLEAARRMASAGDYDGAVLFLYGYMLLALDRAGQVVLHRGKTNRMYLSELSGQQTLRELLRPAMLAFEEVFFGRHPTDQQRFLQLWNNLELFHNTLEPIMKGRELVPEVASI